MNKKRVDYNIPNRKFKISLSWLLGYIEGDESFWVDRRDYKLGFSIGQLAVDIDLLNRLKDYFNSMIKHVSPDLSNIEINNESIKRDVVNLNNNE